MASATSDPNAALAAEAPVSYFANRLQIWIFYRTDFLFLFLRACGASLMRRGCALAFQGLAPVLRRKSNAPEKRRWFGKLQSHFGLASLILADERHVAGQLSHRLGVDDRKLLPTCHRRVQ